MRCVILAAGRGSRMGAATAAQPKGMVALRGQPLLERQIAALHSAGIAEIAIVRGYRADSFPFDLTYFDNPRWECTNMVASLMCAEPWITEDTTLVAYADIVYCSTVVSALESARGDVVISYDSNWLELWRRRFSDPLSDAETFRVGRDGRLLEIGQRAERVEKIAGQYMGLMRLTPAGARRLIASYQSLSAKERDSVDMTAMLNRLVQAGECVDTVSFESWWCEVDSESDLRVAESIVPLP